jgi:hypothetical protein
VLTNGYAISAGARGAPYGRQGGKVALPLVGEKRKTLAACRPVGNLFIRK